MPNRTDLTLASLLLLPLLSTAPHSSRAQPVQGIPPADGFNQMDVMGVSGDGKVVFGTVWNWDAPGGSRAFRWEDGEITLLNPLPGDVDAEAYAASADGSVVVGKSCGSGVNINSCRAVRWTGAVPTMLPFMSGNVGEFDYHDAYAVSADGGIVAGYLQQNGDYGPVRWSGAAPAWALPNGNNTFFVHPHAMSDDGRVIAAANYMVSSQRNGYYSDELFRIVDTTPVPLFLPTDILGGSVIGISGDGTVIVGAVRRGGIHVPVQWGPEGYEELPLPDGGVSGEAIDASFDGKVVLGRYHTQDFDRRTAIWREGEVSDLQSELDDSGADMGESSIADSYGISADGTVVVARDLGATDFAAIVVKIPLRLTVNVTGDEGDIDLGDGKCDVDLDAEGPQCTFRAALQEANALPEEEVTVAFEIPASEMRDGSYSIEIKSTLDPVTRPLTIDATTQPGYQIGSSLVSIQKPVSLQMVPNLGLRLHTDSAIVRGLTFANHSDAGILITGDDNLIEKNVFDANAVGVKVEGGSGNTIGVCPESDDEAAEQEFSGNAFFENEAGILLSDGAAENLISCNIVTVHPFPDRRTDEMAAGIFIMDAGENRVFRNQIDSQVGYGVVLKGADTRDNELEGNRLGEAGANAWGILVNSASGNQIGGDGAPNIIFQSGLGGVLVLSEDPDVSAEANVLHNLWVGTNEKGEVEAGEPLGLIGIAIGEGAVNTEIGKQTSDGGYSIIIGNQKDRGIALFTPLAIGTRINSALIGFGKEVINGGAFTLSYPAGMGIHIEGAVGTQIGSWTSDFATRPSIQLGRNNDRHIYVTGKTGHRITTGGLTETSDFPPVPTQTTIRGVRMLYSDLVCRGEFRGCDVAVGGISIEDADDVEVGPQVSIATPGTGIFLSNAADVRIFGTTMTEVSSGWGGADVGVRVNSSRNVRVGSPGYVNLFGVETSLGNHLSNFGSGIVLIGDTGGPEVTTENTTIQATVFEPGTRSTGRGVALYENVINTEIGGSGEGEGNVFRNMPTGILLKDGSPGSKRTDAPINTTIAGNLFEDVDAATGEGNTAIEIEHAVDTHIGGALAGANVIRNLQRAIVLHRPAEDRPGTVIVGNEIHGNASNGIIGWSGTDDFLQDPIRLPHPTILGTVTDGTTVTAAGAVIGHPNRTMRIDFYSSEACRSVNEGKTFLLSQSISSGGLGFATFQADVPVAVGEGLTITATDLDARRTSEFSLCFTHQGEKGTIELLLDPASGQLVQGGGGLLARLTSAGKAAETHRLFVTPYDQAPLADQFSGQSAVAASGAEIQPVAAVGRYWRVEAENPAASPRLDLCLDASSLSEDEANEAVVIQRSSSSGGLWAPADTHLETHDGIRHACASGVVPSGDFGFGSGRPALLGSVALLEPSNGAVDVDVPAIIRWQVLQDAASYDLQVAVDPAFSALVVDTTDITDTSLSADSLHPGALHYWRVRGTNAVAEKGPWSPPFRFATTAIAVSSEGAADLPNAVTLHQNYPNPFNPQTTIPYEVPHAAHVRLTVFDVLGREVARLVDGPAAAGRHEAVFDAASLPTGLYVYRIEAGDFSTARRMVLVK